MSIQKKIFFSLLVPAVLMVGFIFFTLINFKEVNFKIRQENSRAALLVTLSEVQDISRELKELVLRMTVHKSSGVSVKSLRYLEQIFIDADKVKNKILKSDSTDDLEEIIKIFDKFDKIEPIIIDQLVPAIKDQADEAVLINVNDLVDFALQDSYNEIFKRFDQIQLTMEKNLNGIESNSRRVQKIMIAGVIAIAAVFIFIGFLVRYTIINKLKDFISIVKGFTSGDGDLRKKIEIRSKDEFAEMAGYFNKFISQVSDIIRRTKTALDDNMQSNITVSATMEELASVFNNQTSQVSSVASAMEEMSSSSVGVNSTIDMSKEFLDQSGVDIREGVEQLNIAMTHIEDIKEKTERLAHTIDGLQSSSLKIEEILSVINDIADQTNLLALNAAIEAARAGDAGRGFAVVADEVRKLAERTQKSTGEIEEIIVSLQSESQAASSEMDIAGESVLKGVDSIKNTKEAFSRAVVSNGKVEENFGIMTNAVTEQTSAISSVSSNAHIMAVSIDESSSALHNAAETIQGLQVKTEDVVKVLNFFKV